MGQETPYILVGNALSTLVAANKLAEAGADVIIINGSNNWGGHFATVSFDGLSYDAGMVLHEFTSYSTSNTKEDLTTYNPSIRNDAGRFCNTVHQYVSLFQETHEITGLKMCIEGKCYDDILIANSLNVLAKLPFADSIKKELLTLIDQSFKPAIHASNKLTSNDYNQVSYHLASIANHGTTFHNKLIEPFCKKLLNVGTDNVLAQLHRVPWLPLFYPETLLSYLQGTPQKLPPTIFSYPNNGGIGDLAHKLRTNARNNRHVSIINEHPKQLKLTDDGAYEISFNQNKKLTTRNMAWSSSLGDLLKALDLNTIIRKYEKCSFALIFLTVPTEAIKLDFTVLSIVDPEIMTYRITNQSRCSSNDNTPSIGIDRIVIEINTDYLAEMHIFKISKNNLGMDLHNIVIHEMIALGIVANDAAINIVKILELKNALPLPNAQNKQIFAGEMTAVVNAAPSIALLGSSSGFSSSSFNHQVLQGLKLYETWGNL